MKPSEVKTLIVKYLAKSISVQEMELLNAWIDLSEKNREIFSSMVNSWILTAKPGKEILDSEKSWQSIKDKIVRPKKEEITLPEENRNKGIPGYLKLAASWLVFFLTGSGLTYIITSEKGFDYGTGVFEISAPLGARTKFVMPDNTVIWLNAGSNLTYDEDYGNVTRTVQLTGEAYFDVGTDKKHPFIVKTDGLDLKALGTKFNVKAYSDESYITAILEEGSLGIEIDSDGRRNKKIVLNPNEKIIFYKDSPENTIITDAEATPEASLYRNVNTKLYTSWKDNRWIIEGETLGTLSQVLERRYNLKIIFMDEELKTYKFSGAIENETVDQIFEAMRLSAPLNFTINKDTVVLTMNKYFREEFNRISTRIQQ